MQTDYIFNAFDNRPVKIVSGKKYVLNPLTDHQPITKPELLQQIIDEASAMVDFKNADFIVGEEDRGGYICSLLSIPWHKPFTLVKWNPSGLEGELKIEFRNAYTHGSLYLNGVTEGLKKAIIIEDLIDTGGTVVAMVELLRKAGVEILDIFAVAEKTDYDGKARIIRETGLTPKVLLSFGSEGDTSKVTSRYRPTK